MENLLFLGVPILKHITISNIGMAKSGWLNDFVYIMLLAFGKFCHKSIFSNSNG